VVAKRFRSCSIFLLSLSDIEFFKSYFALFPYGLPDPDVSRQRFVKNVLREEFGGEISEQLLLPPSSEMKNEKQKQTRRENHTASIANACEAQDTYASSWLLSRWSLF
jgi:hypothetical protein